jgi:hypothetical protein
MPQIFYHPLSNEEPRNPSGDMPRPLTFDTRGDHPPRMLDQAAVAQEMSTYYFVYRLIFRLYRFAHDHDTAVSAKTALPTLPLLVDGWTQQKVYYLDYSLKPRVVGQAWSSGTGSRRTPFAATLVKGMSTCFTLSCSAYLEIRARWRGRATGQENETKVIHFVRDV